MKVWKRATVALKDAPSLIAVDDILTATIVKATSHDELSIDTESALFIYRQVRVSPSSLRPIISAISSRIERTRSWTVALKGMMLVHGFFLSKTTVAESIGRLPFDLSGFGEGNSRMSGSGGLNLFVRAYFAFLDRRSILFHDGNRHRYDEESSVMIRLVIIRKMQIIVDSLIRIKPIGENMNIPLINEAMSNVISEILEIYSWISRRIAEVMPNVVHSKTRRDEANMAMKIVAKSLAQGNKLKKYFEFCREIGVSNGQKIPNFVRVPDADVMHLDQLVRMKKNENQREAMEKDWCKKSAEIYKDDEEEEETEDKS